LLKLIRTSDALTIVTICEKLVDQDDKVDFEIGKGSLWVSERESWRREVVLAMGYGCAYLGVAEEAVESNKHTSWTNATADQRRDFELQKVMMAEIVQEYLYLLNEDGCDVEWVLMAATALAAICGNASTLTPPVLPLVVRNPYLSLWLGNARGEPWEQWPMFYTGAQIGLSVMAAVPESGLVYPLVGRGHDSLSTQVTFPTYLGSTFDASTTNLTYSIQGGVKDEKANVILSFISPITPTSTFRQSLPASYIKIYVEGNFDLSIYIDINGQWVSGDDGSKIKWELADDQAKDLGLPPLKTWKIRRSEEEELKEKNDRAEWGTLYFTGPAEANHESGTAFNMRNRFKNTGALRNATDSKFRNINEDEPVFAFSKDFKLKSTTSKSKKEVSDDSILFTIAHIQDPVVQFAAARGLTLMRPLWASWFDTAELMISHHYLDFEKSSKLAAEYSEQLAVDALKSGSEDYKDIVALSARQVMGATSFSGTSENPLIFLKEISSNGDFQTVDVIFPAFPFFLYTNPRWLAYLLEPLIEHQMSGQYPNKYSMHDIGTFPIGKGYPDGHDEYMPLEECGNMLIMGLALVNSLGGTSDALGPLGSVGGYTDENSGGVFPLSSRIDKIDSAWGGTRDKKQVQSWLKKSYKLWKQWTGYLVEEALIPANQLSTDDFAGWLANQTNLALKGIIGIRAMSGLSEALGESKDAAYYRGVSDDYIEKWQDYGFSKDGTHAMISYTWYGSWTTIYNLFADSLLCFHLPDTTSSSSQSEAQKPIGHGGKGGSKAPFIDEKIYKMQSDWYHNVMQKYGLPLDSRHLYTKSDWQFFAAAVASKKVREEIVQSIALWVNETVTDRPLTDLYETEGKGGFPGPHFFARPVVGGHFAFLALEGACDGKAVEGLDFLNEVDVDAEDQEQSVLPVVEEL
ncbi:hypothetical protein V490_03361, partial [Pseudogymnoascus sp. VKM F-3557]